MESDSEKRVATLERLRAEEEAKIVERELSYNAAAQDEEQFTACAQEIKLKQCCVDELQRALTAAVKEQEDHVRLLGTKEVEVVSQPTQLIQVSAARDQLQEQVAQLEAGLRDVDTQKRMDLLQTQYEQTAKLPSDLPLLKQPLAPLDPTSSPLHALFCALESAFASERNQGFTIGAHQPPESFQRLDRTVRALMHDYTHAGDAGHQDWRRYAFFNNTHYVRNLVDANEDFELMVLCWAPGQVSRVHNHGSSHCWLTCLHGVMQEELYIAEPMVAPTSPIKAADLPMPGVLSSVTPCPKLIEHGTDQLLPGHTGHINDNIALHAVRCPSSTDAPGGVTLHLYSPPIRRATLYEPDENRVVQRTPGFYSIRGTKC